MEKGGKQTKFSPANLLCQFLRLKRENRNDKRQKKDVACQLKHQLEKGNSS